MSSARKRAAIQKANNEADHLRQRLMLAEHHNNQLRGMAECLAQIGDERQAQIDALMREYCPDKMTPEQIETASVTKRVRGDL